MNRSIIVWFRQDLRLSDNPALYEAAQQPDKKIIPLYILDDENAGAWKMGGASRVWLHHSLTALNESLNGKLIIKKGDAKKVLSDLIKNENIDAVYWNRCYEPWRIKRDEDIKQNLGVECKSFNGSLLWEPWKIKNQQGGPYKVFTPFYRKGCLNAPAPREPISKPNQLNLQESVLSDGIDSLELLPKINWHQNMTSHWTIGEKGAQGKLGAFLAHGLNDYKEGRNFPAKNNVSQLSPYLHFGEISPHQVWYAADIQGKEQRLEKDLGHFHSELGWREFSNSLLYHFPNLPTEPFQEKFADFPWTEDDASLEKWRKGETGYPIVDAAMRELWETGYMHNRCRMVVGSFLVKNMLLHWHEGEKWFWDTLIDADLANNSASWQWIAGCGADAAPYFRIFNPVLQSKRFDPDGDYIRKWVPELKDVPDKHIHEPWEHDIKGYPKPILDHGESRDRALAAYEKIKG